jgi:hypothetical protein
MYYTYWTYQITTGYVVLAVYAFFLISLLLERSVLELTASRNASQLALALMNQHSTVLLSCVLLKLCPEPPQTVP